MASKLQIFNLALNHLGMQSLTSDSATNPSANACNLYYPIALKDVFAEHRWAFATVKETLALATEEIIGWSYIYVYPSRSERVWCVFNEGTYETKEEQEYEVVFSPSGNRKLVCSNLEDAYAEYTYRVDDTTIYDAKFVMALSFKLASLMAHTLTTDDKLAQSSLNNYILSLGDAKMHNHQEKIKKVEPSSAIINSRA